MLEYEILEDEKKIFQLVDSYTDVKESFEILLEKKSVYDKSFQLTKTNADLSASSLISNRNNKMINEEGNESNSELIAGVIKAEDDIKMKRMIFRASRGTALVTFFDYINQESDENKKFSSKIEKKIFTIFLRNSLDTYLSEKILKVCDLYGVSRYNIPKDMTRKMQELNKEISDKKLYLSKAEISIRECLKDKLGTVRLNILFLLVLNNHLYINFYCRFLIREN